MLSAIMDLLYQFYLLNRKFTNKKSGARWKGLVYLQYILDQLFTLNLYNPEAAYVVTKASGHLGLQSKEERIGPPSTSHFTAKYKLCAVTLWVAHPSSPVPLLVLVHS